MITSLKDSVLIIKSIISAFTIPSSTGILTTKSMDVQIWRLSVESSGEPRKEIMMFVPRGPTTEGMFWSDSGSGGQDNWYLQHQQRGVRSLPSSLPSESLLSCLGWVGEQPRAGDPGPQGGPTDQAGGGSHCKLRWPGGRAQPGRYKDFLWEY